jgi:glycosyltransferase involved in cell wall biosynthesis
VKILCLFSTDIMPWVITRHWLKALVEDGAEVYVGCPPGPYARQLEEFGLPVREVYVSRNLNPINILRAIRSVHKLLVAEQWDMLNCHGAAAGMIGRAASAAMLRRPIVVTTNHGYYFDENMNPIRKRLAIITERLLGQFNEFTMFVSSEDHKTAIQERIVRNEAKAATILNGIDLADFPGRPSASQVAAARERMGVPVDAKVIGMIGRLILEKGIREFFAAARKLCDAQPDLYVIVVGDALPTDRGAWKTQLIAKVDAAGLTSRFRFTGIVPNVYDYMCAFDILVHPTYKESFGRVIAEAMAIGLPVVATNVRGCRELVVPGETGILVPYKDVEGIVKAVTTLLNDSAMRLSMGDAGRSRVVERYDQRAVIGRFVRYLYDIWEETVSSHAETLTQYRSSRP